MRVSLGLFAHDAPPDLEETLEGADRKLAVMVASQRDALAQTRGLRLDLNRIMQRLHEDQLPFTGRPRGPQP